MYLRVWAGERECIYVRMVWGVARREKDRTHIFTQREKTCKMCWPWSAQTSSLSPWWKASSPRGTPRGVRHSVWNSSCFTLFALGICLVKEKAWLNVSLFRRKGNTVTQIGLIRLAGCHTGLQVGKSSLIGAWSCQEWKGSPQHLGGRWLGSKQKGEVGKGADLHPLLGRFA